jgi:2-polyprenyl-3-methyl-5-hydroxy-6-metoxy-1,4-benzoquinol methylase
MSAPHRYFRDAKPAFLQFLDPRGLRVLDLGCGGGHNGEMLKKAGAREVVGVELDPAELGDAPFDAILASDVLEHLLEEGR